MKIDRLTNNDLHIIGIVIGQVLDTADLVGNVWRNEHVDLSDAQWERLEEAFEHLDNRLVTIAGPNWEEKAVAE